MVWGSNPGGGEIFHNCPDRPWGPPSLLYNRYQVSFLGGKVAGGVVWTTQSPPVPRSRKSRAIPLLPSGPSWPVLGWTLPLFYLCFYWSHQNSTRTMSYLPGTYVCGCYQFSDFAFKLGNWCFRYFHFKTKKETTVTISCPHYCLKILYSMASVLQRQSTTMFPSDTLPVLWMTQCACQCVSSFNQHDTAAFWVYHALM